MAHKKYQQTQKRRRGGGAVYGFICLLAVGSALFFTASIFFKVKTVEVLGVSAVTAEQVRRSAQILPGDNMFTIRKQTAERAIFKDFSYVEDVLIRRELPSTVVIEITESRPAGAIPFEGHFWLISDTGKLLRTALETELPGDIPVVRGVEPLAPIGGQTIALSEEQSAKYDALLRLLSALKEAELKIQEIDLGEVFDIRMTYDGRITILLGMADELPYKLRMFKTALEKRNPNERASYDVSMTQEKTVYVRVET
jgi:cell division protein FtsQ